MSRKLFIICIFSLINISIWAQQQDSVVGSRLQIYFSQYKKTFVTPKLSSFNIDYNNRTINIYASEAFGYQPFRQNNVDSIYSEIRGLLPGPVRFFKITLYTDNKTIEDLIPNYYRKKQKKDNDRLEVELTSNVNPWVSNLSLPYNVTRGLQERHIGLWQSHGKYYAGTAGWVWQRPRLFCTTEDLFSQSFITPFLIPMLEHAGAIVFTPRERDTQTNEVIVDNDSPQGNSHYIENNSSRHQWQRAEGVGFANRKKTYENGENPFSMGSSRYIETVHKANRASAEWIPDIPEAGKYAVYVSYKTLPNSISDARYTVYHKGEATTFRVNQQIGGGTWVYLGTFDFDKGNLEYDKVVLTNESEESGVITADAVRFGGGMGNISRGGSTSGLPRYLEGARYYAQWAGMPDKVYNGNKGTNDYKDDINTRSLMINYLSGGSVFNPQENGLKVPFELSMAFHTDAGYDANNFIGTLGIYTTDANNGKLNAGTSRYASRDLCDIVISEIQQELNNKFGIDWQRRAMWNRNYSESRVPVIPSTIIEMLSHQNFKDMQLAQDPNFKFSMARAIYKGILRFITSQHKESYEVQPLPINHFSIRYGTKKNTLTLSWKGVEDPLEPTASPRSYIVYQREDSASFDNGTPVIQTSYTLKVKPGKVYSFYITAVNRGGESFPSQTLSAMRLKKEKGRVLIVNGFDRLSAPYIVENPDSLGFDINKDPGVSYGNNISLCGKQTVFNRWAGGREGSGSLGYSSEELEGKIIAGNTFDYPYIHGTAIQAAGRWGFVSCSREAFDEYIAEDEPLIRPSHIKQLSAYRCIDILMGLQKYDKYGLKKYKTFDDRMQRILRSYCMAGGNLFVSGSYIGSDMANDSSDKMFCRDILKYAYDSSLSDNKTESSVSGNKLRCHFTRKPNKRQYAVTSPEILMPQDTAIPIMKYDGSDGIAAIFYEGNRYRSCIMGFPFESISDQSMRNSLMNMLLRTFENKH